MLTFAKPKHRGVEQLVARRAHNPEAGGSSPSPATTTETGFLPVFLRFGVGVSHIHIAVTQNSVQPIFSVYF